ncbi:MAG TPA: glycosyltransferase family 87 protein [Candidatus Acidoferrum sp.]|nr:glycosyltransferase family 87 protein [Candidatus Acidoferrum sp.]
MPSLSHETPPNSVAESIVKWLTARRLRAQAIVLALCLWGVCAVDFATPSLFDRSGNLKFQDFLPVYVSSGMIAQHRTAELYSPRAIAEAEQRIIPQSTSVQLPNLYGPQVALLFVPLSRLPFLPAGLIWVQISLLMYGICIYLVLKACPRLTAYSRIVAIAAVGFPPLFHVFVRGQTSALVLACFTGALYGFRSDRPWLGGIALGLLMVKPQFLIAIPLILLLSRSWAPFAALTAAVIAQLALAWSYFGSAVMHAYFDSLWHVSRWIGSAELSLAPIQMHSLRSFWLLLIPLPQAAFLLYAVSSIAIVVMAAMVWKSSSPIAPRYAAVILAAVLVNPHLFVYDLLALAPALMLIVHWALRNLQRASSSMLLALSYLAVLLPLLGPLSRWTHLQLSVPCFVGLLWVLFKDTSGFALKTQGHKLASGESVVV